MRASHGCGLNDRAGFISKTSESVNGIISRKNGGLKKFAALVAERARG
jgi:hypothetical protein